MKNICFLFFSITTILNACSTNNAIKINEEDTNTNMASVVSVTVSGTENNYTFNVGISSPDTGCNQYADWWEVVTEDGTLLYRRVLLHSHVNEQPFVRSGGSINVTSNTTLIIRAHMNTSGYGVNAYVGSVSNGFKATTLENNFALELAMQEPLPSGCNF